MHTYTHTTHTASGGALESAPRGTSTHADPPFSISPAAMSVLAARPARNCVCRVRSIAQPRVCLRDRKSLGHYQARMRAQKQTPLHGWRYYLLAREACKGRELLCKLIGIRGGSRGEASTQGMSLPQGRAAPQWTHARCAKHRRNPVQSKLREIFLCAT
jgi:hypothetical protein